MEMKIIPRSDLLLRKIGSRYMIVETADRQVNLTNVFTLNETAAGLWERLTDGVCTPEALAGWLCSAFRVDKETALADVHKQLEEWKEYGLVRYESLLE